MLRGPFGRRGRVLLIALAIPASVAAQAPGTITTVAGGSIGDGKAATGAGLYRPDGIALDISGNLFIADQLNHRVRKVDAATGRISTIAGNGVGSFSGDGGPATAAGLNAPMAVAADLQGNVYISDSGNFRVRRVDVATGVITTVAGSGSGTFSGDGRPAIDAGLSPRGLAIDLSGDLYIADTSTLPVTHAAHDTIRKVSGGFIATIAGGGNQLGEVPASATYFTDLSGLAFDGAGHLYTFECGQVRRITLATGMIGPTPLTWPCSQITWRDYWPGLSVDQDAGVLAVDPIERVVRRMAFDGSVTIVTGPAPAGFSGDGGPAASARFNLPTSTAVDASGNVYIADSLNDRVRRIDATTGIITTIAGGGRGDGGPATDAILLRPAGVTVDAAGALYIADRDAHVVRKVTPDGVITTIAGTGVPGYGADGGSATTEKLNGPSGVAVDGNGDVYIADTINNRVRKVTAATGLITTVASLNAAGLALDGGSLWIVSGVRTDQIFRVDLATGARSAVPLGRQDNQFPHTLRYAKGIAVDATHFVYVTVTKVFGDTLTAVKVDPATGTVTMIPAAGDSAIAVDADTNVYIVVGDSIRKADAGTGTSTTIAGSWGSPGFGGDGGPATSALLNAPEGLAFDETGNLYIADAANRRVRKVIAPGCTIPDPFVTLGHGICRNGGWLPPEMLAPSGTSSPLPPPAPAGCTIPDPFVSLGGGTCHNGGWLPPGMPVPSSPTPQGPQGCTGPDPFASIPGLVGVCRNGGWVPVIIGG
jgi:sugar lactone lactonase YvrE